MPQSPHVPLCWNSKQPALTISALSNSISEPRQWRSNNHERPKDQKKRWCKYANVTMPVRKWFVQDWIRVACLASRVADRGTIGGNGWCKFFSAADLTDCFVKLYWLGWTRWIRGLCRTGASQFGDDVSRSQSVAPGFVHHSRKRGRLRCRKESDCALRSLQIAKLLQ